MPAMLCLHLASFFFFFLEKQPLSVFATEGARFPEAKCTGRPPVRVPQTHTHLPSLREASKMYRYTLPTLGFLFGWESTDIYTVGIEVKCRLSPPERFEKMRIKKSLRVKGEKVYEGSLVSCLATKERCRYIPHDHLHYTRISNESRGSKNHGCVSWQLLCVKSDFFNIPSPSVLGKIAFFFFCHSIIMGSSNVLLL